MIAIDLNKCDMFMLAQLYGAGFITVDDVVVLDAYLNREIGVPGPALQRLLNDINSR